MITPDTITRDMVKRHAEDVEAIWNSLFENGNGIYGSTIQRLDERKKSLLSQTPDYIGYAIDDEGTHRVCVFFMKYTHTFDLWIMCTCPSYIKHGLCRHWKAASFITTAIVRL